MTRGMTARWIQRLDQYKFVIEHRKREKDQNADSLSKKTEFYALREIRDENLPKEMANFKFLAKPEQYHGLPRLGENDEQMNELNLVEMHTKESAHCVWKSVDFKDYERDWVLAMSEKVPEYVRQGVFSVIKEHAAHRFRIKDLLSAQENDNVVKCLKLLVTGWQGRLPQTSGLVATKVRAFFFKYKSLFYHNKDGILMRHRRPTEYPTAVNDVIILPALFQMEAMHLAHDLQSHVGETKTIQMILSKFDWPGLHKDVSRYVSSCLTCQASKPSKQKMKFPLKSLESGSPNELVQIDHLKLSKTKEGFLGVLMVIDHFTKFAQAIPYIDCTATETCDLIISYWIEPYGAPLVIQSDNGPQFTAELTAEMMKHLDILQIHSSPYHPQTNGLVERQNRTLIMLLRTVCSRRQDDWHLLLGSVLAA